MSLTPSTHSLPSSVVDAIEGALRSSLDRLVKSGILSLDAYAKALSKDLARALRSGDQDLLEEVSAQARALAEQHRVRLTKQAWGIFEAILDGLVTVILAAVPK